jgi:FkbM family methyltransferase
MSGQRSRWLGRAAHRLVRWLRPWMPEHRATRRRLQRLRAWLPAPEAPSDVGRLIACFGRAYPRAHFLQIGANDGALYDPLRREILRRHWRGIMVEPVPDVFERLRHNYRSFDELALENVAIAPHAGKLPFYHLARVADPKAEGLPVWYTALGSFRKDVILSHRDLIPDIERRLVTREVPCISIDALCRKHGFEHVDLIQIDTEGYDYEVIKLIDFTRLQPRVLLYEHHHLGTADRKACRSHLTAHGYDTIERGYDTLALRVADTKPRDAALLRIWQRIRGTGQSP